VTGEKEQRAAFLTALTTEHFVLQTAASATVSDAASRSSLYVVSLSSSLVAIGFASRSDEMFVPFATMALSGVFVLGLLTIVRLVDTALENMRYLAGIARIRAYYRTLGPDAAIYFDARHGRWPEGYEPSQDLGLVVALGTTSASVVAVINGIVAGTGVAMSAGRLFGLGGTLPRLLVGAAVALLLVVAFVVYERWRFSLLRRVDPAALG
jgi:hypothetical protein